MQKRSQLLVIILTLLFLVSISIVWYLRNNYYYRFNDDIMNQPSPSIDDLRNTSANKSPLPAQISEKRALQIAKQHGFTDVNAFVKEGFIYGKKSQRTGKVGFPTIRIISCELNKTMHIDPVDGKVIEINSGTNQQYENMVYCGGVE